MFDIVSAGELLIDFAPSINKADKELYKIKSLKSNK